MQRLNDFDRWLFNSWPGDEHVYHTGFLFTDRWLVHGLVPRQPLHDNAKSALQACEDGLVLLVQRRLDAGLYDYIAVRRRERRPLS